jgi:hypothetical protein
LLDKLDHMRYSDLGLFRFPLPDWAIRKERAMSQPPASDHSAQAPGTGPSRATPPRRGIPFFADMYNGAVFGDWSDELGFVGLTTQAICGIIPVVGTICAWRDFRACRRKHDRVGMVLNGLAMIPFLGFFPKTAEVIRVAANMGNAAMYMKNVQTRARTR